MKAFDAAKQHPGWTVLIATAVTLAGGFTAFDKLSWYWQSHSVAYAAKEEAEQYHKEFESYLYEQRELQAEQSAYTRAQAEFNERLLELQEQQQQQMQQQVPNVAPPQAPASQPSPYPVQQWDEQGNCYWQYPDGSWVWCQ